MIARRIAVFAIFTATAMGYTGAGHAQERVSSFGQYRGYTAGRYDSFVRESQYVPVSDGTRIALDLYRPALNGTPATDRLPVALMVTRYWRSTEVEDGSIQTVAGVVAPGARGGPLLDPAEYRSERSNTVVAGELLRHGYLVIAMDNRGTGASFGVQTPRLTTETQDMGEVIEWAAAQPWSTGKVGMFGGSYLGIVQLAAAMGKPKSLAAIFPAVPNFPEVHRILRPGGVYNKGAGLTMRKTLVGLSEVKDQGQTGSADGRQAGGKREIGPARTDEDRDGSLRAAARAAHGSATFAEYIDGIINHPAVKEATTELALATIDQQIDTLFYADRLDRALVGHDDLRRKLAAAQWPEPKEDLDMARNWLDLINASGVPTYLWDGWQDPMPTDRLLYFYNLTVPTRITIGPWSHGPGEPNDPREDAHLTLMATELLRWFDHWLRQIPNGIEREPKVQYAVMQDKNSWQWRSAPTIPPPEARATDWHFTAGAAAGGVPAGRLAPNAPEDRVAKDDYTADYGLTTGEHTRLHDATGAGPISYPDLAPNDARALTYTTAPLDREVVFAGFPIVTLHVSSTSPDPSFIVYLEEVDAAGRSTLVTQGFMRASHRTPWQPPFSTNGTPWTSSLAEDVAKAAPLTAGPAEIKFALHPAANRFDRGHQIRLSIALADEGAIWVIPESPRPVISVWRDRAHSSRLTLPVLPD